MFKPPFITPDRRGTELWPSTGHTPTKMSVTVDAQGVSPQELLVAQKLAHDTLSRLTGRMKQYFLSQRIGSNLGVSTYISQEVRLAPGVTMKYIRSLALEKLQVNVSARVVLEAEKREPKLTPPGLDTIVIKFDWELQNGSNFDMVCWFVKPAYSTMLGEFMETNLGIFLTTMLNPNSEMPFTGGYNGYNIYTSNNPAGRPFTSTGWLISTDYGLSDTADSIGPEYAILDLRHLRDMGYKTGEIEIYGQWRNYPGDGKVKTTVTGYAGSGQYDVIPELPYRVDQFDSKFGTEIFKEAKTLNVSAVWNWEISTDFLKQQLYTVTRMGVIKYDIAQPTPIKIDWGEQTNLRLVTINGYDKL